MGETLLSSASDALVTGFVATFRTALVGSFGNAR
jgi:hypothetical protein